MLVETRKLNKREINVVSSRGVDETFEKEHKEVLYAIEGRISKTEGSEKDETRNLYHSV